MEKEKHSILVVDDDSANLFALTQILTPEYAVSVAKNGKTAVKLANSLLPDVILLDVFMPDMDGYEVLSELKDNEKTREIPVIFITGLSDSENEVRGLALGAADYINKSLDETIIKLRVKYQIQKIRQMRTIESLNKNLENALLEAQEANKAKSSFLSTMSHEIRTPMNAILGITEIQLQNEKLDSEVRDALEKIYSSGDMLLGIINDILDLSKIEAGKLDLMIADYEIASLISDTVQLNIMRVGSRQIEFKLEIDENIPSVLSGDELRVKQVLNNVLSNAFKYTSSGSVTMSVSAEYPPDENIITMIFRVSDTGQGMTKEQVNKLFDEYTRFNLEANRKTEGTGLGMSITRNLLKIMGGEISVESEPSKGSVFTIRLPQGRSGSAVLSKEMIDNLLKFRTKSRTQMKRVQIVREYMPYGSVMVVDDVEMNIYVAKGLLAPYGLKIDSAESGFEAVEKIKNGNVYDIVFMDHMMPDMDGIEAAKIIRDMGYDKPIVALTANAVAGQTEIFLDNGFDDFISKPIDVRQMNVVLNKFIRDKQPPEVVQAARASEEARKLAAEMPKKNEDDNTTAASAAASAMYAEIFTRDASKSIAVLENICNGKNNISDDNLRKYVIHVHGMKSALANIGELELSSAAMKLEAAGKDNDIELIMSETPAFLDSLKKLTQELTPKKHEHIELTDEDKKSLREKLLELKTACVDYNESAAEELIAGLRKKRWSKNVNELFGSVSEHLLHSDFDDAVNAVDIFIKENL